MTGLEFTKSHANSLTLGSGASALPDIFPPLTHRHPLIVFASRHPAIALGVFLLVAMTIAAVFAPWLGTIDPAAIAPSRRTRPPSETYWFGTDMLGRDLYSRVLYGGRVSLLVGFSVALFSSVIGLAVGLLAGFIKWADAILMRVMDGLMSIPSILLAISFMALTQGSIGNVVLSITIAEFPRVARLTRSVVLTLRTHTYVEASIGSGSRTLTVIIKHILPNAIAPLLVQATYICASAMIIEAILSFIGAGVPPIIPSWGNIMSEGRSLWQIRPHLVFIPAVFLSVTVLAVNLLGDGLRDALDPKAATRA